jgi:hypothetical protein
MKKLSVFLVIGFALVCAPTAGRAETQINDGKQTSVIQSQAPLSATDDEWQVAITPYAWIPSIDADIKVPVDTRRGRLNGEISANQPWYNTVSDIFKGRLDVISADGRIEVSKGKWGAFVDGYWIYTKASGDKSHTRLGFDDHVDVIGSISATVKTQIWQVNFGPRYLVGTRALSKSGDVNVGLEIYGGGRINGISNSVSGNVAVNKLSADFNNSADSVFAEPMLGIKTIWALGPNFVGIIRGDVGGFNAVDNNTDCDLEAGIAWLCHKNTYIDLAYRARGQWQSVGSGNDITVRGWFHGPEIGMTFKF